MHICIGKKLGDGQWYEVMTSIPFDMNIVYNVGDAINKIGFGMAVWYAAKG